MGRKDQKMTMFYLGRGNS